MYELFENIAEQTPYSENSFNVELLFEEGKNSIRIMALRMQQQVPEHTVDTHACVYVLEGEIEFTINQEHCLVRKGSFLLIERQTPHSLYAKTDAKMLLVRM